MGELGHLGRSKKLYKMQIISQLFCYAANTIDRKPCAAASPVNGF